MSPEAKANHPRRWWILVVLGLAQLMVVLDATIVNIALPSAQADLGFSDDSRQWVITAYALAFGSLLLLGGRIGDIFGRKRTFVIGLFGFAGASALAGAAGSFEVFVACPGAPGSLRRPARPLGAVAALDHVHRPGRARQGVRRLRRDRRRRCRGRAAARRRPHRVPELALDHVRQPRLRDPRRARRARAPAPAGPRPGRPDRHPGRGHRDRRAVRDRLRVLERRDQRLGRADHDRQPRRRRRDPRRLRLDRAPRRAAAAADARRPRPHPRRLVSRRRRGRRRDVRRLPLPHLLHAADPRASRRSRPGSRSCRWWSRSSSRPT